MVAISALLICVLLGLLSVFQTALVLGAPIGRYAWGGSHDVLPARLRIGSAISIVIYGLIAVVILDRAALLEVFANQSISEQGAWFITGYFALGTGLNALSRSAVERYTMTPLVVVLALLSVVVASS